MTGQIEIENVRFAVLDRPVCVWSLHVESTNLRFLRGIDPEFFLYQSQIHQSALGADHIPTVRRAALALRLNYGMALEAFFGLLGAVLQAPDCVFGWLNSYTNAELTKLVDRISTGASIKTLPPFRPPSWKHIASVLLEPLRSEDPEKFPVVIDLFARAWATFAEDFLGESESREYNSLKHSFRVEPAAVAAEFKHEDTTLLRAESKLAHSFPYLTKIPDRKSHFNVSRITTFLEPTVYSAALVVLALSINNLVSYARNHAGDSQNDIAVRIPSDLQLFDLLWKPDSPIKSMRNGGTVVVADDQYWTDADILGVYEDVGDAEV